MRKHVARLGGGFTLVELLAVIAIIAVLLAILLPALGKARRKAIVLASPIAYAGADNRVHLTDATGKLDVVVAAVAPHPYYKAVPTWSPSGQELAFRSVHEGESGQVVVCNPMNDRSRQYPAISPGQVGWVDSRRIIEINRSPLRVRSAETGALEQTIHYPFANNLYLSITPTPPGSPGPYVAGLIRASSGDSVAFLRKDFTIGRLVFEVGGAPMASDLHLENPRVDPMGEFVAWSMQRRQTGTTKYATATSVAIAIKPIGAPLAVKPTLIGDDYPYVHFCDWTEQGTLLANASDGKTWQLVIYDRTGRLVRRLETAVPPQPRSVATYRKYGHR